MLCMGETHQRVRTLGQRLGWRSRASSSTVANFTRTFAGLGLVMSVAYGVTPAALATPVTLAPASQARANALATTMNWGPVQPGAISPIAPTSTEDLSTSAPAATPTLPAIGLGADAGLPDGFIASLVLRPASIVRLSLGAGTNTSSPGFRAGVTLLPLGWGPSLSIEGGHYMAGGADGLVKTLFGGIGKFASYVGKVDYSFANAHAGLDFGREHFTFFVHGGLSYVKATLSDVVVPIEMNARTDAPAMSTLRFREDPVLRMWTPSVKLGLIVYLQ